MTAPRAREDALAHPAKLQALFVGIDYAGQRTRFDNLIEHTQDDQRIVPEYCWVTGWDRSGRLERLPLLPNAVKGRLRATMDARVVAKLPRPDVIWSAASEVLVPYLWSFLGPLRRPLVLDLDCTLEQLEQMAPQYFARPPRQGIRKRLGRLTERALWSRVTFFAPWSRWARDALLRSGIHERRISVLPPGVDLKRWRPSERPRRGNRPTRLLFVGGDWKRKGGDMLLEVFRSAFADRCELDVVTRGDVASTRGVSVHRFETNSPGLIELYRNADLFVLPTTAECFGIAAVEAMASGLPVIMGDVGGARDIVDEGSTGWLIPPRREDLRDVLERAIARPDVLVTMGREARRVAEERFDGKTNDQRIVDLMVEASSRGSEQRSSQVAPDEARATW